MRGEEVAVAYVSLVIDGDQVRPGVEKALGGAEGVAEDAGKKSGESYGKGFSAAALVVVGAAVAKAASTAIWDAVKGSASTQEFANSVGTLLGDESADKVKEWAKTLADSRGLSNRQALESVKNFSVFAQAAGLGGQEAADFSMRLTELASDLAAFNDRTPEEALQAIRSGLAGETEPLKAYGILLNDAALRQEAMNMGIYDGNGVLSAQQKVLATNSLLLTSTTTQQGAFGRESEGLNQIQARLTARLENLSDTIGARLLPMFEQLLGGPVMDFVNWLSETPGALETIAIIIGVTLVGAFTAWAASIWAANAALLANPITWVVLLIIGAIAAVVLAIANWEYVWQGFSVIVVAVINTIIGAIMLIPAAVAAAVDALGRLFGQDWGLLDGVMKLTTTFTGGVGDMIPGNRPGSGGTIPGLAAGGSVRSAGTVLVGEEGPELLHLGRGAMVQPLDHYSSLLSAFEEKNVGRGGTTVEFTVNNPVAERSSETLRKKGSEVAAALALA